jgi:hypothetical protein
MACSAHDRPGSIYRYELALIGVDCPAREKDLPEGLYGVLLAFLLIHEHIKKATE